MKIRIVISVLLALVARGQSAPQTTAEQAAAVQTGTTQTAATQTAATQTAATQTATSEPAASQTAASQTAASEPAASQTAPETATTASAAEIRKRKAEANPKQSLQIQDPPLWLLPLLIASVAGAFVAVTLQPLLFRRTKTLLEATITAVREVDAKADRSARGVLEKLESARTDGAERITSARDATLEQLSSLSTELGRVREDLARLTGIVERWPPSQTTAVDTVRVDQQVLAEHWKSFREKQDLGDSVSREEPWERLLDELSPLVPADLMPSFDAVMTPYREHRQMMKKLAIIPQVVQGGMPLTTEAAESKRARDLTQILIAAQRPDDRRLHFRFQSWVTDTFLPFADLYLQSYQKAHLEQRDGELKKGMSLVRQILRIAAVEPVEVTLGETRFDSTRHIGRLTSSDPRFSDGVITGVVRNGFIEGGHQVIRQPEVIVNRVR